MKKKSIKKMFVSPFLVGVMVGQIIVSSEDLYEKALQAYRAGQYRQAKEIILQKPKKEAGDYNLLGWIELKLKEWPAAEEAFAHSLRLKPDLVDSYAGLGFVFLQQGDFRKAIEYFEKGLAIDSKNETCLEGIAVATKTLYAQTKPEAADKAKNRFFARGNYFWIQKNDNEPSPIFIKGVNLGVALPGKYPSEFPEDENLYREWLNLIAEMGANAVRVYTILPPEFYRAFQKHNSDNSADKKLFLIQGIWVELPEGADFRNEAYLAEIKNEIKNAVDVIHGRAEIKPRYGHAHGKYTADVGNDVLAFIFGREWEPAEVIAFNLKNHETEYKGEYLIINNGSPFEVFLTEMIDYLIGYEDKTYGIQRPVAFVNWPTCDPLFHPSEATLAEEIKIRKKLGEIVPEYDLSKSWDEDAVSLDETKIIAKLNFRAGLFASYHVYPYYPDFMKNDEKYAIPVKTEGSVYYVNYLRDLKAHYRNWPLLIAEFGLPTSRGIARFHPERLNHGGLTEDEQAEALKKLFLNIKESGCAGGIVFSWIDEWWKTNWMTRNYENNDPLWYNAEDPEENYGLMAVSPSKADEKLMGNPSAWSETNILYSPEDEIINCLSADFDEGYLYLKLDLKRKLDWKETALLLAIDTYGEEEGDHLLPFNLNIRSAVGFEFVALLHGKNSCLLVDDTYAKYEFKPELAKLPGLTGYWEKEEVRPLPNENGLFSEIISIHRRRFSREGRVFAEKIYKAGILKEGRDFIYFPEHDFIELKLPWALLNFLDPSQRRIIYGQGEGRKTEGIRILAFTYRSSDDKDSWAKETLSPEKIEKSIELMKENPFRWPEWTKPNFKMKLKKGYYVLKEMFHQTEEPWPRINLPENFDFNYLLWLAYQSKEEFLKNYTWSRLNFPAAIFQDPYGYALACLVKGLVSNQSFYLLEAQNIFSSLANFSSNLKEKEMSHFGWKYLTNVLESGFPHPPQEEIRLLRIKIKKEKIKEKGQRIILGQSSIKLRKGAIIKTQVERVTRDWLSGFNPASSPSALSLEKIVPWHEGARIRDLIEYTQAKVYPVWGTKVKKFGDTWWAPDETGLFRFPLWEDKIYYYPTNFIIDSRTVIINDTHGLSAIAWDALGSDLVIGCGDHPGKVEAAYHLAMKGLNIYMPADRALSLLIGVKTKGQIIGTAPIKKTEEGAIIGYQPVTIDLDEPVVVSFSDENFSLQYYDTPFRYFRALENYLGLSLKIIPVKIPSDGRADVVIIKARELGARVVGIRVRYRSEHDAVAGWLKEDKERRAILFHSAIYDEGYRLFFEFPEQTSFGDLNINFKLGDSKER